MRIIAVLSTSSAGDGDFIRPKEKRVACDCDCLGLSLLLLVDTLRAKAGRYLSISNVSSVHIHASVIYIADTISFGSPVSREDLPVHNPRSYRSRSLSSICPRSARQEALFTGFFIIIIFFLVFFIILAFFAGSCMLAAGF